MAHSSDVNIGSRTRVHESAPNASDDIATGKPDPVPSPNPANEAIIWNEITLQAIEASIPNLGPPIVTRVMAMESLAVFNALNALEGGASAIAAVAQAAHDVLVQLFPAQSGLFDDQLV